MLKHLTTAAFAGAAMLFAAVAPSLAGVTNTFSATNATQDGGTFSYTGKIYATQAVSAANGALSLPSGLKYAFASSSSTATGSFTVTITLPSGVLFASTPTLTADGIVCTNAALASGGNGNSFIAVSANVLPGHAAGSVCSVTLGAFNITGATALETASPFSSNGGSFFQATSQVTASSGTTGAAFAETAATPLQIAASGSQLVFSASGANPGSIDLASPSFGKLFSGDVDFFNIGSVTYGTNLYFAANGTSIYEFTATSLTFKLTGALTGLSSIFLNPTSGFSCANAVPPAGSTFATISGGSATFSDVGAQGILPNPFASNNYGAVAMQTICVVAGGTTILSANPTGFGGSATIDTTTQNIDQSLGEFSGYNYNGAIQQIQHSPNSSSYLPFIRIVNNSGYTVQVFAHVVTGAGTGNTVVESGLAPDSIDQLAVSTIVANAGLSGQASMTLFATGPGFSSCTNNSSGTSCGVTMSQGLVNPGGGLVQYGSGASP